VSGATGSTGTQDTTTPSYSRGGGAAPTTPTTNPYADMQSKLAELTAGLTSMSTQVNTPTPTRHETNIPKARGGISMLDFQNDARNSVQSSIDAINASYVDMLKRQSEEEEDIEGQSRAAAARGGDLQSSAFGAREAKMNVKFGEQREGIEAKRQASIAQVEMQAQQIAQN